MKARLEERERARREAAERKRAEREAKRFATLTFQVCIISCPSTVGLKRCSAVSCACHYRQQNQSSILEHSRDTHHGPVPLPHQPLAVQHTPPQLQPKPAQPQPRPTQPQPGPAQPQPRPAQPQPGPAQPLPPSSNAVHSTVAVEPRLGQPARPVVSYAPPPQLPTGGEWHAAPAHLQTIRFILSDANRVEDVMPKPPATLYAHTGTVCMCCIPSPVCGVCVCVCMCLCGCGRGVFVYVCVGGCEHMNVCARMWGVQVHVVSFACTVTAACTIQPRPLTQPHIKPAPPYQWTFHLPTCQLL